MSQRYVVVLADSNGNVLESASQISQKVKALMSGRTKTPSKSGTMVLPKLPARVQEQASEIIGNSPIIVPIAQEQASESSWASEAASYASVGAALGTVVPGVGNLTGAAVGATVGVVASLFT